MKIRFDELFTMDPRGKSGRIAFLVSLVIALVGIAVVVFVSHVFEIQELHLDKFCVFGFGLWTTIIEIRRLRDIDWPVWLIIGIITPFNLILIIWLLIAPGKQLQAVMVDTEEDNGQKLKSE